MTVVHMSDGFKERLHTEYEGNNPWKVEIDCNNGSLQAEAQFDNTGKNLRATVERWHSD